MSALILHMFYVVALSVEAMTAAWAAGRRNMDAAMVLGPATRLLALRWQMPKFVYERDLH